jgi:hypothetical protein
LKGFLSTPSPPLTYVAEKRLGFRGSLSLKIAQRLSEAVVDDFRKRFDTEELKRFALILDPVTGHCTPYNVPDSTTFVDGWTDACRWIHERRLLFVETGRNQLRLYSVHISTDDPVFSIVHSQTFLSHFTVMPSSKNRSLEVLITLMIFMVAWAVTLMVIGGTTFCADASLFFFTSRLGSLWLMHSTLSSFLLSLRVTPPFGTQTPFLLFKLIRSNTRSLATSHT